VSLVFRKLLITLIIIYSAAVFGASKKTRLAVLDLQAVNIPESTSIAVTETLSTELVNTGMFQLLERAQIAKILNEQGLQQSGITDSKNAVEAGKMLNANRVLIGSVSKLGTKYIINVKIVDISKAKIEFAAKESAEGEEDLIRACENLTNTLVYKITGVKIEPIKTVKVEKKIKIKDKPKKDKKAKEYKEKDPVKKKANQGFNELDDI